MSSVLSHSSSIHPAPNDEFRHVQAGGFRLSVAGPVLRLLHEGLHNDKKRTLKVEQDIRLVVLEHLSDELDIHVLNVDLLNLTSAAQNWQG